MNDKPIVSLMVYPTFEMFKARASVCVCARAGGEHLLTKLYSTGVQRSYTQYTYVWVLMSECSPTHTHTHTHRIPRQKVPTNTHRIFSDMTKQLRLTKFNSFSRNKNQISHSETLKGPTIEWNGERGADLCLMHTRH